MDNHAKEINLKYFVKFTCDNFYFHRFQSYVFFVLCVTIT